MPLTQNMTAAEIIDLLNLKPHPEGGYFRETFRDDPMPGSSRAASTLIYYLLAKGDLSGWHRVDAAEVFHWYAGAPLLMNLSADGQTDVSIVLGPDLVGGQRPQLVVPKNCWQTARSGGAWTLVGCTVSPGFEFSGFEMAATDWSPGMNM